MAQLKAQIKEELAAELKQQMQADITAIVNEHFERQLRAVPQIDTYLRNLA